VAATLTLLAQAGLAIMVIKVGLGKFGSRLVEFFLLDLTLSVNVPVFDGVGLSEGAKCRI